MKKILILIGSVLALMLMLACEEVVTNDIDLGKTKVRMVVEGGVTKVLGEGSTVQKVFISQSLNAFEAGERVPVTDAIVTLEDQQGNSYVLTQDPDSSGLYQSDPIKPSIEEVYSLTVLWNEEEYFAEEKVRAVPPIERIYQTFEEETFFDDEGYRVNIDFTDTPSIENFYYWQLFVDGVNGIIVDPGNESNLIQSDEFFDGNTITGYRPNPDALPLPGQTVEVIQYGISQNYFDFLSTLFQQTATVDGIFDTPPVPIRGNVLNLTNPDNYALGYFTASEVSIETILIQE
ncbi:MAG: DUF4249 domain-containing protein [Bacteroidota bacterium]